jgi:hypothetical protein
MEANMEKKTVVMRMDCLSEANSNLKEYDLTILNDCAII